MPISPLTFPQIWLQGISPSFFPQIWRQCKAFQIWKLFHPRCSHPASGHIVAHTHEYPLATKRENCRYKFFPKFGEASSIRNLKISRNLVHSSRSAIASQTPLKIDEEVTVSFFQPAHICDINSTKSYTTQKLSGILLFFNKVWVRWYFH